MLRTYLFALLAAGCAGCEPPRYAWARAVMTPDGLRGLYIECTRSQADCMDEAATACPSGYAVMGVGESENGTVSQTQYNAWLNTSSTVTSQTHRGSMLIQCRVPAQAPPQAR